MVSDGVSAWTLVNPLNASSTVAGLVALSQDLGGTAAAPTVVAITGAGGKIPLRSGCNTIEFNAAASAATIKCADGSTFGTSMNIFGQHAGGTNQNGGPVNVTGGNASGTGVPGYVEIGSSVSSQLRVGAFSGSRRYVAIATTMPSSGDVPTGDGVVYLANAVTNPSSNPSGGGVLYVDAGALKYRGTGGTVTTLALA